MLKAHRNLKQNMKETQLIFTLLPICLRRFDMGEQLWLLRRCQLRDRLLERRRWEREREREWCLRELRWERDLGIDINLTLVCMKFSLVHISTYPYLLITLSYAYQKHTTFLPGFWPWSRMRCRSWMMGAIFGVRWWVAKGFRWALRGCTPWARLRVLDRPNTEVRNTLKPFVC